MKNIFKNKSIFFALGLITGAFLVLMFSFAVPGRRTYVGWDAGIKTKMPMPVYTEEEVPERIVVDEQLARGEDREEALSGSITSTGDIPMEAVVHTTEMAEEAEDISSRPGQMPQEEEEETRLSKTEGETPAPETAQPIIDHSHIPLRWEYKMKE